MTMNEQDKFDAIEHQIWHLVEDVRQLSNEITVMCKLFAHIHRKDIPAAWVKMYKFNYTDEKSEHQTTEEIDQDCLVAGIKDLLKRFGKLKDEDE